MPFRQEGNIQKVGTPGGTRTPNGRLWRPLRYQLRYRCRVRARCFLHPALEETSRKAHPCQRFSCRHIRVPAFARFDDTLSVFEETSGLTP
jgi:hypothetical protein